MSEATVFVDDAVRGTLPDICAKDGVPATGRFRMTTEVGRSNRIGRLWRQVGSSVAVLTFGVKRT